MECASMRGKTLWYSTLWENFSNCKQRNPVRRIHFTIRNRCWLHLAKLQYGSKHSVKPNLERIK